MDRRKVAALCVVAAVAGVSLCFTARRGVESDLFALVGASAEVAELRSAASAMAKSARFLVKAEGEDAARARLSALGAFGPEPATDGTSVSPETTRVTGGSQLSILLASLAPYAHGFLSPAVRGQLERGEFAAVRDAAIARLYSPMPPVIPPDRDPFLLFTDYALEMSAPTGRWVVVNATLAPDEALAALEAVKGADDVRCAGAPFHTAVASARSKREINVLSAVSLFCVVLFGWLLTRSFRFIPLLLGTLAAAFCVASAVLFAAFPKPHLITFVFGTTLIGLGVDYVYHAMTARGSIAKPLTFSFLSTAACFLPLMFSGVGVMRQVAVFTVSGLATVYAGVLACMARGGSTEVQIGIGPSSDESCAATARSGRLKLMARLAILGAISILPLCWMLHGRFVASQKGTDLSRFYRPDPYLAEGERIAAAMAGGSGFLPSAAEQRRNANLVRRLYKAEGANLCAMTGLPEKVLALPAKFRAFDPKGAIEGLFDSWLNETDRMLEVSFLVLAVVLVAMFRRECLDFILPVLASYIAVFGLLTCLGEALNLFARICFFIFIGLGLDYCVFRWHARRQSRAVGRAVWYSFLTSLVAFGLLGFTEFAVTRIMGITLAFGLAVAYLAARLCCGLSSGLFCAEERRSAGGEHVEPEAGDPEPAPRHWHEQDEQCASRFWMQFMWYSYAWLGKGFQKCIFLFAMPFIYAFSKPARVALRKFYDVLAEFQGRTMRVSHGRLFRHLLGFAWGLMDKTDAATLKKDLPSMSVRDDAGWRAFKGTVDAGRGAFILCTHVGTIGVLPALANVKCKMENRKCLGASSPAATAPQPYTPKVHAFQQMGHDAVFMKVFMRHFDRSRVELHAVEDIGVETAVEMQSAIRRGELVIMAGDRTSAGSKGVLRHRFLGRSCVWPKGAFKFAELMEAPVFGVTCICTGWNRYEVHVAALGDGAEQSGRRPMDALLSDYVRFLEAETVAYPGQWYQFYDFFGDGDD